MSLAIIDACPVTSRLTLPQHYMQTMTELQHNFLPGEAWEVPCNGLFGGW